MGPRPTGERRHSRGLRSQAGAHPLLQELHAQKYPTENSQGKHGDRCPAYRPFQIADLHVVIVPHLLCKTVKHGNLPNIPILRS
jgi:hypothetical protein